MMRSLYSGISGLRNHQTRMDVIGNNIANVNTAGYKTSRVIFQDIFSQNVASGMANQGQIGGTNPTQIGLGIRLSTVDVIHSRAAFQRTDRETDMMINGDGFFIVAQINPETGEFEPFYTRAGNFDIDNDGFLVNSQGLYVLGTSYELETGVVDPGSPAIAGRQRIPAFHYTAAFPAVGTEGQNIMDYLSTGTPLTVPAGVGPFADMDALTAYFRPATGDPGAAFVIPAGAIFNGNDGSRRPRIPASDIPITAANFETRGPQLLGFHRAIEAEQVPANGFRPGDIIPPGTFVAIDPVTGAPVAGTEPATQITITVDNIHLWNNDVARDLAPNTRWPATARPAFNAVSASDPIFGIIQGAENAGLNRIRVQAERMMIPDINPDTGLPFGAPPRDPGESNEEYTVRLQDWLASIEETAAFEEIGLPGFSVADNGDISVIVGNRKVVIGRLAIGMFSNPPGLEKAGNSLYRESASSGPVVVTEAFNDGAGKVDGGGLEMSNVDLSNEFTDMIVTQRGFQANSRIITVSDTLLEELVNLKR